MDILSDLAIWTIKYSFAVLLYRPIMTIPTFSVTVRRLHDVNKSGWWCCLWILPFPAAVWFWLIPWLTRPSAQTGGIWTSSARPEYGRSCRGFFPILLINKPYLELLMRNKECCRMLQISRVRQPVESYLFRLKNDMPQNFCSDQPRCPWAIKPEPNHADVKKWVYLYLDDFVYR